MYGTESDNAAHAADWAAVWIAILPTVKLSFDATNVTAIKTAIGNT
jgi:hypothetical protein